MVPSMLDLIGLSPRLLFPPGGEELYRQIALLTDMGEGDEVLAVACGRGVSLEYFVREYGVHGAGVDSDQGKIQQAEDRVRESGIGGQVQFQSGRSDKLPYRDAIFDISIGELGLASHCDAGDAVEELVRVTKPGGFVVLVQLVWKAPVDEVRQLVLAQHLGTRPMMLVEWKRRLKALDVSEIHTEAWADEETSFRAKVVKPFPDFAEIFSFWEKIGIMRRAWGRWGWRGVRTVLEREYEVHRLLTRERILGLDLVKGRTPSGEPGAAVEELDTAPPTAVGSEACTEGDDTAGLPLFEDESKTE
jgi:ubiquinone/menaquinone biosynthesis C-methylase UbiE